MLESEAHGVPFSRTEEGKIYQRPFGGQTLEYSKQMTQRICVAADRPKRPVLHTLYQQCLSHEAALFMAFVAPAPATIMLRRKDPPALEGAGAWYAKRTSGTGSYRPHFNDGDGRLP